MAVQQSRKKNSDDLFSALHKETLDCDHSNTSFSTFQAERTR